MRHCTLLHLAVMHLPAVQVDVNGEKAHPLWKWMKEEKPGLLGMQAVQWNFSKFLLNRNGQVVERYLPTTTPESIVKDIEKLL